MTITKEFLHEEIEKLDEEGLEAFYQMIREAMRSRPATPKESFMAQLRKIRIDAPEDFAANFDAYVSGEKHVA